MHILKSALVFICLIAMLLLSINLVIKCIKRMHNNVKVVHIISALCCVVITCLSTVLFGDYVYPFERTLDPVLIAEFDVPEEYELEYPGQKFWHGAYEEFGLYSHSFYFNPNDNQSIYGFGWPPMDFERHSYIITYGQKIESLSYNVWDTIDAPIRTGAKVGHMILEKEFSPEKVYIYQIPKIRIENDVNDIYRPWD